MKRDELFKPGGYVSLPKQLLEDDRLNPAAKLVWAVVADRLGMNNESWPGEPSIAQDIGVSVITVSRAIKDLIRLGWLSITSRPGKSHLYTPQIPAPNGAQKCVIPATCVTADTYQIDKTTPINLIRHPHQNDMGTPIKLIDELPNRTTSELPKLTTEVTAAVAAAPLSPDLVHSLPTAQSAVKQAHEGSADESLMAVEVVRPRTTKVTDHDELTEAQKSSICANLDSMMRYLLWGLPGLDARDSASLAPSIFNWQHFGGTPDDPKLDRWTIQTFMGYYWFHVSQYRGRHGIALSVPNWPRLGIEVKRFLDRTTPEQAFKTVSLIPEHFDLIKRMLGKIAYDYIPDERSLGNRLILQMADQISSMGSFELEAKYQAMARAA